MIAKRSYIIVISGNEGIYFSTRFSVYDIGKAVGELRLLVHSDELGLDLKCHQPLIRGAVATPMKRGMVRHLSAAVLWAFLEFVSLKKILE